MTRLKHAIEAQQGVQGVDVNHAAGSITVKYDAPTHGERGIFGVLEDLDLLIGAVIDAPHIEAAPAEGHGHSKAAGTLIGALDGLDKHVAEFTGHTMNLRTLFPLTLAGLGVWQIVKNGLVVEMVPGWLLLWLAFDSFVKLHSPAPPTRATATPG
jgi:copper chaperone CopZ